MNKMDDIIRSKVNAIIRKNFSSLNLPELNEDESFLGKIEMDSIQLIALISQLESEFDIDIPLSILEAETLNQFLTVIEEQILSRGMEV